MNRWRIASIEVRLMVLLSLIALVVSTIAGCTLFWALKREVQSQEMTEVAGKLELIQHLASMHTEADLLHDDLIGKLNNILVGHENLKVWILNEQSETLYGGDTPLIVSHGPGTEIFLRTRDGGAMRGMQEPLHGVVSPGASLIVAADTRPSAQFLYQFVIILIFICAVWVGVTAVLAAWAVRRSLAPLRRLSAQAAEVQPDNLAVRLPEAGIDRELKEFTRTFNSMLGRVQAAYQQMEGFNADVAHELRTPLATLISGTEIVLSSVHSMQELRELLESNLEELGGLRTLINDMLFLARADGGELARDLLEVSVAQEIAKVHEFYEASLDEAGVSLLSRNDSRVAANPRLLRRAIANLVSNAIKATPAGGVIEVNCAERSGEVEIRVSNPGAAIAQEALPRIFDRFYRTDDARSGPTVGHGLGLAIVRAIAQMHGGRAFASSDGQRTVVGFSVRSVRSITKT